LLSEKQNVLIVVEFGEDSTDLGTAMQLPLVTEFIVIRRLDKFRKHYFISIAGSEAQFHRPKEMNYIATQRFFSGLRVLK
jgi:hypothetical protein